VTQRGTRAAARSGSIGGDDTDCGGGNIPADDVPPNVWFNDEDPSIIPEDLRREEEVRRLAAKLALKRYKKLKSRYRDSVARDEAGGGGTRMPIRPKVHEPRIWWIRKDGTGLWKRRIHNAEIMINDWGTFNLSQDEQAKARCRPRTSAVYGPSDRGHKMLQAETVYIRRTHRAGYGLHANRDMEKGDIAGPYCGFPYTSDQLGRHSMGRAEGTHRLAIRRRLATMPLVFAGIDGPILKTGAKHDGKEYDLRYYRKNGFGSALNSDRQSKCNCKVIVEYKNYEGWRGGDLYVDDEYCPAEVPRNRRVVYPRSPPPTLVHMNLVPRPTQRC
jgi:hypothetical protein